MSDEDQFERVGTDERGASAVEYGLLVALIAIVILVAIAAFGLAVDDLFVRSCDEVAAATSGTSC